MSSFGIYPSLCAQNEGRIFSQRSASEYIKKFKEGRMSVNPKKGAGWLSATMIDYDMDSAHELILSDKWLTVDDVIIPHKSAKALPMQ